MDPPGEVAGGDRLGKWPVDTGQWKRPGRPAGPQTRDECIAYPKLGKKERNERANLIRELTAI